jgi:hypothetical protein
MSKIALSGNASGTGTLTLAAPNTNSDRTLTLPDGSGALYNQSNIVGTVSESGGVPTGAIIERGSNANGEYVKYADGTMICFVSLSYATAALVTQDEVYTFPATFAAIPNFQVTIQDNRDGTLGVNNTNRVSNVSESSPATASGRIRAKSVSGFSFATGGTWEIGVMLFGRWF